ncbi:hypothetical protein [Reyranella sp.]|jgi:hypothetical protein|uniref:hypothetical protein n=1 Tax=Reyranella sp. TaxID=1929291 RepID=UPI002F92D163
MSSLAADLFAGVVRFLAASYAEAGLWVISTRGRIVGSLVSAEGDWRLCWFEDADPRLAGYAGAVDGDVEALAHALTLRLGAPVRLDPLAG